MICKSVFPKSLSGTPFLQSRSGQIAWLSLCLALLVLYASLRSISNPHLYEDIVFTGVLPHSVLMGIRLQDYGLVLLASSLLVISGLFLRSGGGKTFLVIRILTAYFLYTSGLLVMAARFSAFYWVYLGIFAFSLYTLQHGRTSFPHAGSDRTGLPLRLRRFIGWYLAFLCLFCYLLWIRQILPIPSTPRTDTFAVFELDLSLVMAGLGLTAYQLLRGSAGGVAWIGVCLLKISTLILTVAVGEYLQPTSPFSGMTVVYILIALSTVLVAIIYLFRLRILQNLTS